MNTLSDIPCLFGLVADSKPYNTTGDTISREALIREIGRTDEWYKGRSICDIIDNAQAVEIDEQTYKDAYDQGYADGWKERYGEPDGRPKGKWIITREEQGPCGIIYKTRKCNQCYWENSLLIPRNFCPKCGADMREEERGEEK